MAACVNRDRIGRGKLAIGGFAEMTVFIILVTAASVAFLTGTARITLVVIGFARFIVSFAVGVGDTGWPILFVGWFPPETNNLTLDQVTHIFDRQASVTRSRHRADGNTDLD